MTRDTQEKRTRENKRHARDAAPPSAPCRSQSGPTKGQPGSRTTNATN
jgi:hypothetical protein